ncbi:MAG TPA: hypothetical protein VLN57_21000 [Xanthobacteraceae bacterium]|nr:hypothetical protein [Xanthobacteraceae bacterium]
MPRTEEVTRCGDCDADLTHRAIVVTMETGGQVGAVRMPRGEVKLCAGCAIRGVRPDKIV